MVGLGDRGQLCGAVYGARQDRRIRGTAEGGSRTLTRGEPDGILSPARLPVPPLRLIQIGQLIVTNRTVVSTVDCPNHAGDRLSAFPFCG